MYLMPCQQLMCHYYYMHRWWYPINIFSTLNFGCGFKIELSYTEMKCPTDIQQLLYITWMYSYYTLFHAYVYGARLQSCQEVYTHTTTHFYQCVCTIMQGVMLLSELYIRMCAESGSDIRLMHVHNVYIFWPTLLHIITHTLWRHIVNWNRQDLRRHNMT